MPIDPDTNEPTLRAWLEAIALAGMLYSGTYFPLEDQA